MKVCRGFVIAAYAAIQFGLVAAMRKDWIPAFAGMTVQA